MDFFTPPPRRGRDVAAEERDQPPWTGPPKDLLGGTVAVEKTLFQNDALAIVLASAVAFPENVKFHVRLAARRLLDEDEDTWWERRGLMFEGRRHRTRPSRLLKDEVLRFGVRLPDGTKATTVEGRTHSDEWPPPRPEGPVLRLGSGGGGGDGGSDRMATGHWNLWLWPLPPPEPFEFVVQWPAFDVPLTFTKIDGEALATAAERARPYWS
ncbi:hypothetical protein [Streptosporangium saharense]|uniref:Uncharacterized protein n=1 Tax=Streptosporangium saharense TaxID=1706840 RepID=A0A7W7VKS0_9ACTN|nr:hypothetical protein [Streptosporangium saharense]MBB4913380.1 hypothetical protein [Streptosporangium saharense]